MESAEQGRKGEDGIRQVLGTWGNAISQSAGESKREEGLPAPPPPLCCLQAGQLPWREHGACQPIPSPGTTELPSPKKLCARTKSLQEAWGGLSRSLRVPAWIPALARKPGPRNVERGLRGSSRSLASLPPLRQRPSESPPPPMGLFGKWSSWNTELEAAGDLLELKTHLGPAHWQRRLKSSHWGLF